MWADERIALVLFTRVPVPGKVKTRLQAIMAEELCAAFQEALALDLLERLAGSCKTVVVCYSDEWAHVEGGEEIRDRFLARARAVAGDRSVPHVMEQAGADLGERMADAIERTLELDVDACVLMGSDLPYVTGEDIYDVLEALGGADVAFGPSRDGGYWSVGLKSPFPELFENKSYGRQSVLAEALATCRANGRVTALAGETGDVDTPEDFGRLCECVRAGDRRLGPRTTAFVEDTMAQLGLLAG